MPHFILADLLARADADLFPPGEPAPAPETIAVVLHQAGVRVNARTVRSYSRAWEQHAAFLVAARRVGAVGAGGEL